ncbi:uncharacterized protein BP5553_09277 [Venustampulla echinocandica]|uniref:2EXR domain-containing protein n=1 Tax=Venustampulla echinocandica TaxID=2656787 RepID=A0A370TCB3_9HELO|nr:uncharacterized protein BP5553_09277 [Venustampulla echinocandica]RDL31875.1 hypothetical protein BP5553_09277 [Venustampulla echinocandica]
MSPLANMISTLPLAPAGATAEKARHALAKASVSGSSSTCQPSPGATNPNHMSSATLTSTNSSPSELLLKQTSSQDPPAIIHSSTKLGTSTDLREFTGFPELPQELRVKIWRYAMSRPRTRQAAPLHFLSGDILVKLSALPLLTVCSESYRLACETYWLSLGNDSKYTVNKGYDIGSRINPINDVVYLPNTMGGVDVPGCLSTFAPTTFCNGVMDQILCKIQHPAIDGPRNYLNVVLKWDLWFLRRTNIKTLTLTLHSWDCRRISLRQNFNADLELLPPADGVVSKGIERHISEIRDTLQKNRQGQTNCPPNPEVKVAVLCIEGKACCIPFKEE